MTGVKEGVCSMTLTEQLYRMRDTARRNNDRATEILVQARIVAAWTAPTIARLRGAAVNRIAAAR